MSQRTQQYRYVVSLLFAGLLLAGGGWAGLRSLRISENPLPWVGGAFLALCLLCWRVRTAFAREPGKLPAAWFPGLANQITVFRGLLVSLAAGFLFIDPPAGFAAWIPVMLYSTALILDGFDGFVARLRKETSAFGAFLDLDLDAWGTLIGILLAIHAGGLPVWYIPAGIVYYLFAFGRWRREKRGLPLHPLPESRYRRSVAVIQWLLIVLALLPVTLPMEIGGAAAPIMTAMLAGFLRDWWIVTGYALPAFLRTIP